MILTWLCLQVVHILEFKMASVQTGTVDDLATLSELTESMLLDEIQARYQKGIIYVSFTRRGLPVSKY